MISSLPIRGAWLVTPTVHRDERGHFAELYRADQFTANIGHNFDLRQASMSVSSVGVVRGIHYSRPGQGKYVTCVRGAVLDVIMDLRPDSPTFGRHHTIQLDDIHHASLYLPGELGHGFCALTEQATVLYLQSTIYDPATERAINPLDSTLHIDWPTTDPQLSARDRNAPTLAEALNGGLL